MPATDATKETSATDKQTIDTRKHPSPEAMENLYRFINRVLPKYASRLNALLRSKQNAENAQPKGVETIEQNPTRIPRRGA